MEGPDGRGRDHGGSKSKAAEDFAPATNGRRPFQPARSRRFERSRDAIAWDREIVSELVSVIIPTLNEAENLRCVIPQLSRRYELIVVDGGSTDGTVEVVRALNHDAIVVHQTGRGKGDALLCGFRAASGEIIVTFDGDGSARADEIPRFVEALEDADFAKGSRFIKGGGSADLTRLRRFGNRFLCGLVNLVHRTAYTDLCYGFNAFRRSCLPFMPDSAPGFEIEAAVNIRIARADLRVTEVPSYEDLRHFGHSNLNAFRDGFKILWVLIRERFRSKRWLRAAAERSSMHEPAVPASRPQPAEPVPVSEPPLAPISD
jgi:glycosyltransferase involved in cell wall biosynthesis